MIRLGHRWPVPLSDTLVERAAELELSADDIARLRARKLLFGFAGALLGGLAGLPAAAIAGPVVGLAGFRLPDVHLARAVAAARREVSLAVPHLLDVLSVSVSAGLSPRLALDRASEAVSGRLADELRRGSRDVELGSSWRTALRSAAERTRSRELRRLAVVLDRADRLGTPVAERLLGLAEEVRSERRSRREERAHRAPVQMLFPLVFLILPAFVVAAVVPAILVATRGLT